ncbi:methyltransferase [Streptomyces sp. V2]|uniref:SAM-dependent methyltransferase n=1 Tax=Streptomyces TaxID=1883 RepID=UPI000D6703E9|nr:MULTISPECIES: SAM-dependent methyltransferase [unclassified Streptomyces]PWG13286.1 methyltransferase [Streptomyces sp. V2]QZZ25569.1 SAM-dependent methyltransferase [Streptomyces sp. ST1015]
MNPELDPIDDGFSPHDIDTSVPHSARLYDWYLGGKDHYAADIAAAQKVMELVPRVKESARSNREFMHRAARHLSNLGITQFLDIGTGIPTEPNLHQVVQQTEPAARIVYVDNDPIVLRHAQALLHGTPEGHLAYLHADIRDPEQILAHAQKHLDFTRPVGLSVVALLHFVTDDQHPYRIIEKLLEPLVPGSHLMLSHLITQDPETVKRVDAIYRTGGTSLKARSFEEISLFFRGLEVCDPGIVPTTGWRPDDTMTVHDEPAVYAGVARKP